MVESSEPLLVVGLDLCAGFGGCVATARGSSSGNLTAARSCGRTCLTRWTSTCSTTWTTPVPTPLSGAVE